MGQAGLDLAILDYRNLKEEDGWLFEKIFSHPFGFEDNAGIWPEVLDGIFFIHIVEPSKID